MLASCRVTKLHPGSKDRSGSFSSWVHGNDPRRSWFRKLPRRTQLSLWLGT
ncbi:hypothetical protein LINPERHAP2_LOCUS31482, partial [Linum perenne]